MDRVTSIVEDFSDMFSQKITQVTNVFSEKLSNNKKPLDDQNIDDNNTVNVNNNNDRQLLFVKTQNTFEFDEFDIAYLNQRDIEIKNIQKDLIEVNQIFKDINELVYSQAPLIDSISENISTADDCIKDANKELKKAEKYQKKSNGWLILGLSAGTITTIVTTMLIIVLI